MHRIIPCILWSYPTSKAKVLIYEFNLQFNFINIIVIYNFIYSNEGFKKGFNSLYYLALQVPQQLKLFRNTVVIEIVNSTIISALSELTDLFSTIVLP